MKLVDWCPIRVRTNSHLKGDPRIILIAFFECSAIKDLMRQRRL